MRLARTKNCEEKSNLSNYFQLSPLKLNHTRERFPYKSQSTSQHSLPPILSGLDRQQDSKPFNAWGPATRSKTEFLKSNHSGVKITEGVPSSPQVSLYHCDLTKHMRYESGISPNMSHSKSCSKSKTQSDDKLTAPCLPRLSSGNPITFFSNDLEIREMDTCESYPIHEEKTISSLPCVSKNVKKKKKKKNRKNKNKLCPLRLGLAHSKVGDENCTFGSPNCPVNDSLQRREDEKSNGILLERMLMHKDTEWAIVETVFDSVDRKMAYVISWKSTHLFHAGPVLPVNSHIKVGTKNLRYNTSRSIKVSTFNQYLLPTLKAHFRVIEALEDLECSLMSGFNLGGRVHREIYALKGASQWRYHVNHRMKNVMAALKCMKQRT